MAGASPGEIDDTNRLVIAGVEKFRRKLLDLSKANRLINFKHSERSRTHIRIIDEIPEVLFEKLEQERKLTFHWIEDPDWEPADERTTQFRAALEQARNTDPQYIAEKQNQGARAS